MTDATLPVPSRRRLGRGSVVSLLAVSVCLMLVAAPAVGVGKPSTPDSDRTASSPAGVVTPSVAPGIRIILPQPTWVNVTSGSAAGTPPAAFGGSAAYDPVDNETVYFGGCFSSICPVVSNQTWVFAHGTWTNVTNPSDAPPGRSYASMDYDANMKAVLLFGGEGTAPGSYFNDTWIFQGDTWTNVSSYSTAPPGRYGAGMAFDPQPEENGSVLFGGYGSTGYLNDTWVWEGGAGWVRLKSASIAPPEVVYTSLAYDAADGYLVQFGGYLSGGGDDAATWELYAGQWWEVTTSGSPPGRYSAGMAYVPSLREVVLFGGYSSATGYQTNTTWVFSNGSWIEKNPAVAPPAGDSFGFALDGTGTTLIAVGGFNLTLYGPVDYTWAYEFTPAVSIGPNVTAAEVGEPVTFTASPVDGTSPYSAEFSFGDGSYAYASGPGPSIAVSHTFLGVGSYPVSVDVTDAVGATAGSGNLGFDVTAGPAIAAHASSSYGDVNVPLAFTSTVVAPGTAPLSYAWEFGDSHAATTENATHAYASAGTYAVRVVATDAKHVSVSAEFNVTIVADPTVTAAVAPVKPAAGSPATFFANVTGGTGPYSYTWLFGDGSVSAVPDPSHNYTTAKSYVVQVWVNDSVGGSTHTSVTVTVPPAPTAPASSPLSGAPAWFWGGVGALAAAAVVGSAVLLLHGRRPHP